MVATFTLEDQSTITVNAFNSIAAKLNCQEQQPVSVQFTENVEDWINGKIDGFKGFQDRDRKARQKWIDQCRQFLPDISNETVPTSNVSSL